MPTHIFKKIIIILLLFLSGLLGFLFSWAIHSPSRLSLPNAEVRRVYHYPSLFTKQLQHDPKAGEKIFKAFCAACHADTPAIPVNAPKLHDRKTWQAMKKLGMPALLNITKEGTGAMPARGGCFECSDEELQKAIEFILAD